MPKVSELSAAVTEDHGVVLAKREDVENYTIEFLSFREDVDLTEAFKGMPGESCQVPHWGYVLKGRLTYRFGDHEEVFEPGDAFYVPPGHVPIVEAGAEYLQFSPADEYREARAALTANMEAMQSA